uniref:Secreted protein n=1 Tax=Anopheles darlingi TaxID=43151 RepID=A0A2M4DC88_ANODA
MTVMMLLMMMVLCILLKLIPFASGHTHTHTEYSASTFVIFRSSGIYSMWCILSAATGFLVPPLLSIFLSSAIGYTVQKNQGNEGEYNNNDNTVGWILLYQSFPGSHSCAS